MALAWGGGGGSIIVDSLFVGARVVYRGFVLGPLVSFKFCKHLANTTLAQLFIRAGPREVVFGGGGGGTSSQRLETEP